jgi:hypothetical protein
MIDTRRWRKSSYSGNQTDCIEVASAASRTQVRDTKDRSGGHLAVASTAWRSFTENVKRNH